MQSPLSVMSGKSYSLSSVDTRAFSVAKCPPTRMADAGVWKLFFIFFLQLVAVPQPIKKADLGVPWQTDTTYK